MRFGLLAFGAGSVLAAVANSPATLIIARLVQGLGAAFLVPGSLALINTVFDKAQSAAIGVWTGWTGTAFALAHQRVPFSWPRTPAIHLLSHRRSSHYLAHTLFRFSGSSVFGCIKLSRNVRRRTSRSGRQDEG